MAYGPAPRRRGYWRPTETCGLGHIPCGLTALLKIIKQGCPCGVGLGLPANLVKACWTHMRSEADSLER